MISDVLAKAVREIDRYLEAAPDAYEDTREEITRVRNDMDALRVKLDTLPPPEG